MSRPPTTGLRRVRLANGVTLLVQRRRAAPAAALVTHVRAGFLDEPDELVGVSHVLEHMLFKGTPSMAPGELAQRTKELGGSLNAYTSYDRTVYYASVPSRNAFGLAALQADQVRNSLIDPEELRREIGVIIQEARRKLDSPSAVAGETLHELLYTTHRIRRWRIGKEPVLARFTRDDVAGYYHARYAPARIIVALVADLDEGEALDMLGAQWSDWQRPEMPVPPGPVEQTGPTVQARSLVGEVALAQLVVGWRAPGVLDEQVPALDVAAAILGLGRGSRLARLLREPGLVNALGVSSYGVIDAGVLAIDAELDPVRMSKVLGIIGETVRDLATRAPAAAEFDRARTLLRARIGRRLERYESRALALADAEALGDVTKIDREEADLLTVTPADVRAVVGRWLIPDGVSGVAYLPRNNNSQFDTRLLHESIAAPVDPPSRSGRQDSGTSRPAVHHVELDGFDILTAQFGETGQTTLRVYRERTVLESPANAGIAALSIRTMVRGTERLNQGELAFAMESLGGSLSPALGADVVGFGATVLSSNVRAAADILAEVLYQPRLDERSVAIERGMLLEDARAVADDMIRFPMQLALGVAFQDSGYGSPGLGTQESVATFEQSTVRAWHAHAVSGGRTTIIAVGDADPEQLADDLREAFSRFGAVGRDARRDVSRPHGLVTVTPGSRVERRDRKQSALAMIFPGPSRTDPDRFAAETWSAIAAGLGGRLFESLRSKRSLAYTVLANSWQRRHAGALVTYIATDPARLDEARAAMLEELVMFRAEPPGQAELTRASAALAGQAEMSRQTAGALAAEIADAWLLGNGLEELDDPAAPYRGIDAAEVHAVAVRSFEPSSRAEGVVAAVATE